MIGTYLQPTESKNPSKPASTSRRRHQGAEVRDIMRGEGGVSKDVRCFGQHHFSHILQETVERVCWTKVKQRVENEGEVARREGTLNHHRIKAQDQEHRHQRGRGQIQAIPLWESEQGGDEVQGVSEDRGEGLSGHLCENLEFASYGPKIAQELIL